MFISFFLGSMVTEWGRKMVRARVMTSYSKIVLSGHDRALAHMDSQ